MRSTCCRPRSVRSSRFATSRGGGATRCARRSISPRGTSACFSTALATRFAQPWTSTSPTPRNASVRTWTEPGVTTIAGDEIVCIELVELVTDYFEAALSQDDRRRFEEHLAACGPCVRYVDQLRTMVELTGQLDERALELEPELRDAL